MFDHGLLEVQVRDGFECLLHDLGVQALVGLGTQRLDGWAFAFVEQPDLDEGAVGDAAHEPAQRVDLADEVALGRPADRGVAGHVGQFVEVDREQQGAAAHAGGGVRGLAAGVPGADHDDVVVGGVRVHGRYYTKNVVCDALMRLRCFPLGANTRGVCDTPLPARVDAFRWGAYAIRPYAMRLRCFPVGAYAIRPYRRGSMLFGVGVSHTPLPRGSMLFGGAYAIRSYRRGSMLFGGRHMRYAPTGAGRCFPVGAYAIRPYAMRGVGSPLSVAAAYRCAVVGAYRIRPRCERGAAALGIEQPSAAHPPDVGAGVGMSVRHRSRGRALHFARSFILIRACHTVEAAVRWADMRYMYARRTYR